MSTLLLLLVGGILTANGEKAHCAMTNAYPPPEANALSSYTVNLDADASDRWTEIATKFKPGIQAMIDHVLYTNTLLYSSKINNDKIIIIYRLTT